MIVELKEQVLKTLELNERLEKEKKDLENKYLEYQENLTL